MTINGDICNFVTAMSALSNTTQRSVYTTTRVGRYFALGLPCAAFSSYYYYDDDDYYYYYLNNLY